MVHYSDVHYSDGPYHFVFSVILVCKKELNLMLKVSETSSQGAVALS